MIRIKRLLRNSYRRTQLILIRFTLIIIKFGTPFKRKLFSISYYSGDQYDGTGAQLQRLASVYSLARFLNIDFIESPITNITIHPTDPYQDDESYGKYLIRVNNFFDLKTDGSNLENLECSIREYSQISVVSLFRLILSSSIRMRRLHLKVFQVNSITDAFPELIPRYVKVNPTEIDRFLTNQTVDGGFQVAIHYRQGVGNFPVYPGQSISRQVPLEIYVKVLEDIFRSNCNLESIYVDLFTDSPVEVTSYTPKEMQLDKWIGTPGFNGQELDLVPTDFFSIMNYSSNKIRVSIHHGGNPLDALLFMIHANVLLISKSSLSYLAALLNVQGEIYVPRSFWHSSLNSWRKFKDD